MFNEQVLLQLMKSESMYIIVTDENDKIIFNPSEFELDIKSKAISINSQEYIFSNGRYYRCMRENISVNGTNYQKIVYVDDTDLIEFGRSRIKRDRKTNLLNYEGFLVQLNDMLEELEDKQECHLAMLDMDNFKALNDTYGHVKGDEILIAFAKLLKESFRKDDLVGRFGGDEFIVAVKNLGQERFANRLEFIQNIVANKLKKYNITITVGMTKYDKSLSYQENKIRADTALYWGKQRGKNKLTIYDDTMQIVENAPLKRVQEDESEIFSGYNYSEI